MTDDIGSSDDPRTSEDASTGSGAGADEHPGTEGRPDDAPNGEGRSPEMQEEEAAEEELRRELDHLEDEFETLKERHLRLAADFENYRRRAENEMTESWIRAQADLVRRLLEALDDLQRVTDLDSDETSVVDVLDGVGMVEKKLMRAMKEAGVEVVEPDGEPFDPETMEAMMRVEADSEEDDDQVHQVFQKGYTFKGHLVRPARVSVLKHD